MAKWNKRTGRLNRDHGWRSKPGYKILVADRGAVRFDYPAEWVDVVDEGGLRLYDAQPPDEKCGLQLSVIYLPPGIDWSALPLANQLAVSLTDREGNQLSQSPISHVIRPGVEIVWTETRWTDPTEHREARSRHLLARGSNIQTLISLTFWPEDAKRLEPAWQEILRSLRLGEYVSDPLRGPLGTIS